MPKKADSKLLGIKVGGLQEGKQVPETAEAKYIGSIAERRHTEGFVPYEELYINVIKPAIPADVGTGLHGMLRSVGYKLYKQLNGITSEDAARVIAEAVVASFVNKYGDLLEPAIRSVVNAVLEAKGFTAVRV